MAMPVCQDLTFSPKVDYHRLFSPDPPREENICWEKLICIRSVKLAASGQNLEMWLSHTHWRCSVSFFQVDVKDKLKTVYVFI